jgi:hypothetical protein
LNGNQDNWNNNNNRNNNQNTHNYEIPTKYNDDTYNKNNVPVSQAHTVNVNAYQPIIS